MAPSCMSVHMVGEAPKSGCCQDLCTQGDLQPPPTPASLGESLRPSGRSGQPPIKLLLLPWVLVCVRFLCVSFGGEAFVPLNHLGFRAKYSGSLSSWCRTPGLMWGSDPLFLVKNLCHCDHPPGCGLPSRGMDLDYTVSLSLLPISLWFLLHIFGCRKSFLLFFNSFPLIVTL